MRQIKPDSELAIQSTFFEWLDRHSARYPVLDLAFAIPNSAKRGKMDGWLMRLSGTRRGVPDVCLPAISNDGDHHGLFLEFKSTKGVLSPDQKLWIARLREAGYRVEVVRSWIEAANIVIEHIGLDLEEIK